MKFKVIFGMFNAIILVAFLFVFLMPFFVIGPEASAKFWGQNWLVALLFLVVLGLLDGYFVMNWKLFSLLEKEDWKSLADYLKDEILVKKHCNDQNVRLVCNALILLGRPSEIRDIEQVLRPLKPAVFKKNAVLFGLPYLLEQKGPEMLTYFQELSREGTKIPDAEWITFFHAFAFMTCQEPAQALPILKTLADTAKNKLIILMSLYFLESQGQAAAPEIEDWKLKFKEKTSKSACSMLIEKSKDQVQVLLLSKFLGEAHQWLYT